VAIAAGNEVRDARDFSPASEPSVCTVGATDIDDRFAPFSSYGSAIDILAPGVDILSTWQEYGVINSRATNTISGTSMASAHIAGLGAYLLGLGADVESLCARIAETAQHDLIRWLPANTVNLFAYNGADNSQSSNSSQG
jgi:cerevisin